MLGRSRRNVSSQYAAAGTPMSDAFLDFDAIDAMPVAALPAALARTAALQARIASRLASAAPAPAPIDDRLLRIDEAAAALQKSTTWLYHHAKELPFTKRVGRSLRFSSQGIRKYLDRQNRG